MSLMDIYAELAGERFIVLTYARLLAEFDLLILRQGDGPEADALRDLADEPWYAMTEQERQTVHDLFDKQGVKHVD